MPIIAVSRAEYATAYLHAIAMLGADAALPKPVDFERLVDAVTNLITESADDPV